MSNPLKIEMVVPALDRAGMEVMCVNLVTELARMGCVVGITCLRERGPLAAVVPSGVTVSVLPTPGLMANITADTALTDHFKRRRPDIIHAHNTWGKAILAARAAGVQGILHTAHGFPAADKWINTPLRWWAAMSCDRIIAVSDSIKTYLVNRAGVRKDKVVVIENGVDSDRFAAKSLPARQAGEPLVVGCVARLDEVKNHKLLIHAVRRLVETDAPPFVVQLLGEGPLESSLRDLVHELDLGAIVRFIGVVEDPRNHIANFDVFVLPSLSEGTSLSILEAMSMSRPVLATSVGGTPKLLDFGRSGVLVASGDIEAMARELRSLLADETLRRELGRRAREQVLGQHSQAGAFARYFAEYEKLVPDKRLRATD